MAQSAMIRASTEPGLNLFKKLGVQFLTRVFLLVFSFLLITSITHAYRRQSAEPFSVNSENQVYLLHITPKRHFSLFCKSPLGNSASAQVLKKEGGRYVQMFQVKLVNGDSPYEAFISNSGHFLTIDEHANAGYEHSLVVYGVQGNVLKDYALEDLLSEEEIKQNVAISVSSRWWLGDEPKFSFKGDKTFVIETGWGKTLSIDLQTGALND